MLASIIRTTLASLSLASLSAGLWLASAAPTADPAARAKVTADYAKSPMVFEMNEGQSDSRVKALARGSRYGLFLTSNESVFDLAPGSTNEAVIRVRTLGSNPAPQVSGLDRLQSTSNYFVGKDQSKWRRNVAHYGRVKYASIYPGVDLIYYGNQGQLEYDYVVAPGADPNSIQLAIDGARRLRIDRQGNLVLQTAGGTLYQHKPVVYQEVDGTRREIAGNFQMKGKHVSFRVGDYDHSKELVVDPSLSFLTYLGGSGTDQGLALTITAELGLTLVAGSTASANFPTENQFGLSYPYTGQTDGFLSVFNSKGTQLMQSTYIGGTGGVNVVTSAAVDTSSFFDDDMAYLAIAGYTSSPNLTIVNGAQSTYGGGSYDGWVSEIALDVTLNTSLTVTATIDFATYLGGKGTDEITGVALDPATKDVFVTGHTTSTNFPVTAGVVQGTNAGGEDAFLTRYASGVSPETESAGTVLFSTYLGGAGTDIGNAIAVYTGAGGLTAYVAGSTTSATLPHISTIAGPEEAAAATAGSKGFLAAINGAGTAVVFNTKFIGNTTTITKENAVTTDPDGNIYIAGNTNDSTLTLVKPLLKRFQGGGMDALVAAYSPTGTPTLLSYWGGSGYDVATGVGVYTSTSGPTTTTDLFIAGYTSGGTFPVLNAVQSTYGGGAWDGFVAMFTSANGGHFAEGYSTFLGGSGTDLIYALGVGTSGNARVAGMTDSAGIATTGAYQTTLGGGYDAFLAEIQTTP